MFHEVVRRLLRVERHGGIKEDEEHDQRAVKNHENQQALAEKGHELEKNSGGEDRRDDTGGVDLERQIGAPAAEHLGPAPALGILHDDAPFGPFDNDDENDDDRHHGDQAGDMQRGKRAGAPEFDRRGDGARQLGDDARKDDQEDAVADPARRDLLAQPHQEDGAADQGDDGGGAEEQARIDHRRALGAGHALDADGNAVALNRRQQYGAKAGVLADLLPARLALLLDLLELGRDGGHEPHDDGRGDVGHDAEGEDRHPPERAAGEQVEHAEDTALLPAEDVGKHQRIDPRQRDVCAEAVDDQRAKGEPQPLLEIR